MYWGQPSVSSQFNKAIAAWHWRGDCQITERPAGFSVHFYSTSFGIMMHVLLPLRPSPFICVFLHGESFNRRAPPSPEPAYKLMSWRIPVWLLRDLWPRFNELLQIDGTMTWERTRGRSAPQCASSNTRFKWKPHKLIPPGTPHVGWPLPSRRIRRWRNTSNKKKTLFNV